MEDLKKKLDAYKSNSKDVKKPAFEKIDRIEIKDIYKGDGSVNRKPKVEPLSSDRVFKPLNIPLNISGKKDLPTQQETGFKKTIFKPLSEKAAPVSAPVFTRIPDPKPISVAKPVNSKQDESIPVLRYETGRAMSQPGMLKHTFENGRGFKKIAKFLLLLSRDDAAKVLRQFNEEEIAQIAAELSLIKKVDKDEAEKLMQEFSFIKQRTELPAGGQEVARAILVGAFGEDSGRKILKKAIKSEDEKPFDFLEDLEPIQVLAVLRKEPPEVLSMILPFLKPVTASKLISELPPDLKVFVVKRIAKMEKPDREALRMMEDRVREKIRRQGHIETEVVDGKSALANILKYMDVSEEQSILGEMETEHPDLTKEIKDKIFTIDMIVNLDDVDLQKILSGYSDQDLAVILKGKSREVEDKIVSCVSANRAIYIRGERERLGPMKRKDVDDSTRDFLNFLRKRQLEGSLLVNLPGDELI